MKQTKVLCVNFAQCLSFTDLLRESEYSLESDLHANFTSRRLLKLDRSTEKLRS